MQGKWRAVGIASISLLVGAFLTIVGFSVRGLLWERPAVEVKRIEADAATVAASAEKEKASAEQEKARAEIAKAKAEAEKAIAEREKAYADLQAALAQHKLAAAEDNKARAEHKKAQVLEAEADFLVKVVNPHINDPLDRMGHLDDRIVRLEAKLEDPGLSTEQRLRIFEEKAQTEREATLVQRAMERKFQRSIGIGVRVVADTVAAIKEQAGPAFRLPGMPGARTASFSPTGVMQ
jgi:hypothetical protein